MDINRIRPKAGPVSKKACPLHPRTKTPSLLVSVNAIPHSARRISGAVAYWIVAALVGILMIVAAMLLPPSSPMHVFWSLGGGYVGCETAPFHSIISSPVPVVLGLLISFVAAAFVPLYGCRVLRQRVVASVVFAVPMAIAGFVDQLACSRWFLRYGPSLGWPPAMSGYLSDFTNMSLWSLNPANWPLILLQSLALAPLWALFVFAMSFVGDIVFGLFSFTPLYGIYD